jgi:CDP-glycerol glycerophosphotransferase
MLKVILRNIKKLILGWGIIVPLSYLIPPRKNLVICMVSKDGCFHGNVMFFYLYLHKLKTKDIRYYFFTECKSVYKMLQRSNLPAVYHPTLFSIYTLLRTNVLVTDNTTWRKNYKYYLLFRSKKVQLWHGIGLKRKAFVLDRQARRHLPLKVRLDYAIKGKFPLYDLFVSSSEFFTQNAFVKSFRAKRFLESGIPRNDLFFTNQYDEYLFLSSDQEALAKIKASQADGRKIILYAPTFRDSGGDAVADGALNLSNLSAFAQKHHITFVFKFHPFSKIAYKLDTYPNIVWYDDLKDIQPVLKIADILITDYSSVYTDYLLLDRPIVFFPYDYEKYTTKDRDLLFDYNWITPGPKCYSQDDLEEAITKCLAAANDTFAARRKEIRDLAFKFADGCASERIWYFIKENYMR